MCSTPRTFRHDRGDRFQEFSPAFVPAFAHEPAPAQVDQQSEPAIAARVERRNHPAVRQRLGMIETKPTLGKRVAGHQQCFAAGCPAVGANRGEPYQMRIRISPLAPPFLRRIGPVHQQQQFVYPARTSWSIAELLANRARRSSNSSDESTVLESNSNIKASVIVASFDKMSDAVTRWKIADGNCTKYAADQASAGGIRQERYRIEKQLDKQTPQGQWKHRSKSSRVKSAIFRFSAPVFQTLFAVEPLAGRATPSGDEPSGHQPSTRPTPEFVELRLALRAIDTRSADQQIPRPRSARASHGW